MDPAMKNPLEIFDYYGSLFRLFEATSLGRIIIWGFSKLCCTNGLLERRNSKSSHYLGII